jgi:hypothetical protein
MIRYSNRAIKGYSYLYRHYNDIEVFIEDNTCKNMWIIVINKVLEGIAKIETVFSLGGKNSVIDACKKDKDYTHPKIYIIDGDFDFIFKKLPELERLFRLNVYCIENLLFSENATLEVAFHSDTNTPKIELYKKINFSGLANELREKFKELFINYLIIYRSGDSLKNVGMNIFNFIKINRKCIKILEKKINNYINKNNRILNQKYGSNNIFKIRQDVIRILNQKKVDILQIISGKEYLIPYVYHFLKIKFHYRGTLNQFKVVLSEYSNFEIESNFNSLFREKCKKLLKNIV